MTPPPGRVFRENYSCDYRAPERPDDQPPHACGVHHEHACRSCGRVVGCCAPECAGHPVGVCAGPCLPHGRRTR